MWSQAELHDLDEPLSQFLLPPTHDGSPNVVPFIGSLWSGEKATNAETSPISVVMLTLLNSSLMMTPLQQYPASNGSAICTMVQHILTGVDDVFSSADQIRSNIYFTIFVQIYSSIGPMILIGPPDVFADWVWSLYKYTMTDTPRTAVEK